MRRKLSGWHTSGWLLLIGAAALVLALFSSESQQSQAAPVSVTANVETAPGMNTLDAIDDPSVWIHPTNPSLSTIIDTDKSNAGGLNVFDLSGQRLYWYPDGRMNNVDVRYNFPLGATRVSLVGVTNRGGTLDFYRVNVTDRSLSKVGSFPAAADILTPRGFSLYHSPDSGKYYAFVTDSGKTKQYELNGATGSVTGTLVRQFSISGVTEGLVADDELKRLYVAQEDIGGILRYGAEPGDSGTGVFIDTTTETGGHIIQDVKGLALYYANGGAGYLIAASQGGDSFHIYNRGDNAYRGEFNIINGNGIDGVTAIDGIDVTNFNFGSAFPNGFFVTQDDANTNAGNGNVGNQNEKLVSWTTIANAMSPPLLIDNTFDPRRIGAPGGTPTATPTATPAGTGTPTATPTATPVGTGTPTGTPGASATPGGTLAFSPTDDSYVAADSPASNFGAAITVQADGSPVREGYLKFDLRSLAGQAVQSARLRMWVANSSVAAQNIKAVADTTWTEGAINYNNRPSKGATIASFTPNGPTATWLEVDLTATVAAGAGSFLSLAMDTASADAYMFGSAEDGSNGVHLSVQATGGGTSSATPTPVLTATSTPSPGPANATTVTASEDTYVSASFPTTNFGAADHIWTDASPIQDTFMKVNLTHLAGQTLLSAKLRLWTTNGSGGVQNLKAVADNSWSENTVTYDAPPAKGAVITTFVPGAATSAWVEVDITSTVNAARGSLLSLALDSASSDGYQFSSSEAAANQLQLVITLNGTPPPVPSSTPTPSPTSNPSPTPTDTPTPTPLVTPVPGSVLHLNPADDAYVAGEFPANNFGTDPVLQSDASPARETYLKFDLRQLAAGMISSARLRMWVTSGSVGVQNIKSVADTTWAEGAISYNSRPPKGATVATFTPTTKSVWREVDITPAAAAAAGSFLSLAIDSTSSDGYDFNSAEAAANAVELTIQSSGASPASPSPTPTQTQTPLPTAATTATATAIATATATPSETVTPAATPSPTATATPTQAPPGAGIVFGGSSTAANTTSSTTLVIPKPADIASGDVLVASIALNGATVSGAPPGWVQMAAVTTLTNPKLYAYYHVTGGATEPATYTWTLTTPATGSGGIARYSGVNNANPLDAPATTVSSSANVSSLAVTGVTTASPGAMIIGGAVLNSSSTTTLITSPAGMAERWDLAGKRQDYADAVQPAPGNSGAKTWTFSSARAAAGWLAALNPQ